MLDRIRHLMLLWRELKEIDALTDRDLADLGMTREQVRAFARMPQDTAERMATMARLFGISAEALKRDHALYLDLVQTCGTCRDRAACALVLEKGDLARPSDCAFCPNCEAFSTLAAA